MFSVWTSAKVRECYNEVEQEGFRPTEHCTGYCAEEHGLPETDHCAS